jgi:hypothetical protein
MHRDLAIERRLTNRMPETRVHDHRLEITKAANNRSSAHGVKGRSSKVEGPIEEINDQGQKLQRYTFTVRLEKAEYKTEESANKALDGAENFVRQAAERVGWLCMGEKAAVEAAIQAEESRPPFVLPPLTQKVMNEVFEGIRERDAHIRLMYRSVKAYVDSAREVRNHTLLYGEPAAAKTMIVKRFKAWFDSVDDGVERITCVNATTLSKAGIEKWILERGQIRMLPEILFINELEKGDPSDFLCLLNIMDEQAEISRLNAKIGKQSAEARILIWADCNDAEKVRNWQRGALWSRFNKRWACVRPNRVVMQEILLQKITKLRKRGLPAKDLWAKLCVDYGYDKMETNDPRVIEGLLEGGYELEDGSYFKDIEAVRDAEEVSQQMKTKGGLVNA